MKHGLGIRNTTSTPYDGPTHTLAGTTYTGATRKPGTKRLLFIADAEVKPAKKKPKVKKK